MSATYNTTDGVYSCDPFNEETPPHASQQYMTDISTAIYRVIDGHHSANGGLHRSYGGQHRTSVSQNQSMNDQDQWPVW